MAVITIRLLPQAGDTEHVFEVADDYAIPALAPGAWVSFTAKNGSQLKVFANNIETVRLEGDHVNDGGF